MSAKASFLLVASQLCMGISIYLLNYPTILIFKSCNILSVVAVGIFCSRIKTKALKLTLKKILVALLITVGMLLFYLGGEQSGVDEKEISTSHYIIGLALLTCTLFIDGFIPDFQAEIKEKFSPAPLEMY